MSRPIARHTYERRARIRRTINLRRRRQVQRAGMVALSIAVLLTSGLSVFLISRTLGPNSHIQPLFRVDAPATHPVAPPAQPQATTSPSPASPHHVAITIDPPTFPEAIAPQETHTPDPSPITAQAPEEQPVHDGEIREFNGRRIQAVKTMRMLVTAYSPDARSCGIYADGITASGYSVWTNGGKLVGADTRVLPFGSLLSIPGYDNAAIVPVLDVGGAIKGNRLDVLFPTHQQARQWGRQWLDVVVYDFVD